MPPSQENETLRVRQILTEFDLEALFEEAGFESRTDFFAALLSYGLADHSGRPVARWAGRLIPRLGKRFLAGRRRGKLLAQEYSDRVHCNSLSSAQQSSEWIRLIGTPSKYLNHLVTIWASSGGQLLPELTKILEVYQEKSNPTHKLVFASGANGFIILQLAPGEVVLLFQNAPTSSQMSAQREHLEELLGPKQKDLVTKYEAMAKMMV